MIDHDFKHDFKLRSMICLKSRLNFIFFFEINFYSVFISSVETEISFFIKSVLRSDIHIKLFLFEIQTWTDFIEMIFEFLIQTEKHIVLTLKLLHHYQHLNDENLRSLPCINLITHRVRFIFEIILFSWSQICWPTHIEWWLKKFVSNKIINEIYELTEKKKWSNNTKKSPGYCN